jgi:isoquinoline 1-oxidoreductase beta subunit
MKTRFAPSRRKFLKQSAAIGGGLSVGFSFPGALAQKADGATEINAWVVIRPDDAIIIRYARAEMGQGSMTSAPMLVAEELECDWRRVKIEYASANANVRRKRAWGDMASVGSRTIRNSQEYLRRAGATAREMLIAAAAQQWGVPASECSASNSFITHGPSKRRVSFGKVADAASKLEPPKDVKLKDPKDWKLIGKSVKRIDIPDTVMGRQRYGIDVQLPGMLYAAIAQCPVFGSKVKSVDASKVEGRRGIVKVLPMESFVAVVADNWWRAKEALRDVHIDWDVGANGNVSSASLMEFYRSGPRARTAISIRPSVPPQRRSKPSTTRPISRTPAWSRWAARRSSRTAKWTSGLPRRTPRPRLPWQRRLRACRWRTSKCTAFSWAADSAGAAARRTSFARAWRSRRPWKARR